MNIPITGRAAFHPYHGSRPIRPADSTATGPGIHHIACTTEEYRWVCQQLSRRRAGNLARGITAQAVHDSETK